MMTNKAMRGLIVLALGATVMLPTSSYAETGWFPSPPINTGRITSYVVVGDGGVNVSMSPGMSGCTSQSGYGGTYASLYTNHAGFKAMQALLLAAYVSGKPISLYLGDTTCRIQELRSW